jgi:hypothetical protein
MDRQIVRWGEIRKRIFGISANRQWRRLHRAQLHQDADGYSYVTVCGVPGMKPVTTKGTLTGDVRISYTLDEVLDLSVEGDNQKIVASTSAIALPN